MTVRVIVDEDLCQGHGMCVLEAPDVFELPKGAHTVTVTTPEPDESRRGDVMKAVQYCPTMAIAIRD